MSLDYQKLIDMLVLVMSYSFPVSFILIFSCKILNFLASMMFSKKIKL